MGESAPEPVEPELERLRKIEDAARVYFTVRGPAVITAARALQDALALPPGVVPELPATPEFKPWNPDHRPDPDVLRAEMQERCGVGFPMGRMNRGMWACHLETGHDGPHRSKTQIEEGQ